MEIKFDTKIKYNQTTRDETEKKNPLKKMIRKK
jgi:hypothetical protein